MSSTKRAQYVTHRTRTICHPPNLYNVTHKTCTVYHSQSLYRLSPTKPAQSVTRTICHPQSLHNLSPTKPVQSVTHKTCTVCRPQNLYNLSPRYQRQGWRPSLPGQVHLPAVHQRAVEATDHLALSFDGEVNAAACLGWRRAGKTLSLLSLAERNRDYSWIQNAIVALDGNMGRGIACSGHCALGGIHCNHTITKCRPPS